MTRKRIAFIALVAVFVLGVGIPVGMASRRSSRKTECINRLKRLGLYLALYESKYKRYPDMSKPDWPSVLGSAGSFPDCGGGHEFRVLVTSSLAEAEPDLPVAALWHGEDDVNVLFFQGRVEILAKDDALRDRLVPCSATPK